jgi:serine/threonine-protein kinase
MSDLPEASPELAAFGKYFLDEELARGGMSRVFRARLRGPGGFEKKLVVKQILPELAKDPAFIALFVQEANTLVQLSHPNLVPVYELGVVDGIYFLAMEWVQGATVAELLRESPLPEAAVAQIGAQIADALRYAHERFSIVHRDVTPRNIIVDGTGHARLLDFGIAARAEHTGRGELFGSPGYMAPEQLRGDALGPESDLFALGCVLYEAVSGKQAWPGKQTPESMVAQGAPAPLAGIDATLTTVISELLTTARDRRPQAAASIAERLRTWLAEHHPRGVQQELSERALRAQARNAAEPRPLSEPPPSSGSGRIEVRSIAVNPELAELLQHATEKLERPATAAPKPPDDTPEPRVADDPEFHRFVRRFLRDLVVITVALVIALGYARYREQKDEEREEAERAASEAAAARPPSAAGPHVATPPPEPVATPPQPSAATSISPSAPATTTPPSQPSRASSTSSATALPPAAAISASPAAQTATIPATTPLPHPSAATTANTHAATTPTALPPSAAETPERVAPKAPGPITATPDAVRRNGLLSVSATPWAEVRLDGKLLGSTPRRSLPLRPGKHTLQLSCPPLAHEARVPIELQPGQELRVSADMQESPPRISTE